MFKTSIMQTLKVTLVTGGVSALERAISQRAVSDGFVRSAITKAAYSAILGLTILAPRAYAQAGDSTEVASEIDSAVQIVERYNWIAPNITYRTVGNYDAKLDVYMSREGEKSKPTILYIHGGGWAAGATKEASSLVFLPFLQLGWNVVNVEYRPSRVALAPAAVEDCLCALRWIGSHAAEYKIDIHQVVVMGRSAGGLLALTTGMIPLSNSGLGGPCANLIGAQPAPTPMITPAAVVNWFGIADVLDLLEGSNDLTWIGTQRNRAEIARLVSPLSYINPKLPPIISIHGDQDPMVPYSQAVRLHEALSKAHVKNKLITIHGGGHGLFGVKATRNAFAQVLEFLKSAGLQVRLNDAGGP